jgi:imidazolonepropionase-like amidohydrolase
MNNAETVGALRRREMQGTAACRNNQNILDRLTGSRPMKATASTVALLLISLSSLAESTAFVNVNVLPMSTEEVLHGQTVIVTNGRIEAIGRVDQMALPDDVEAIDGTDRFLMPGLSEMHGHVPPSPSESLDRVLALFVVNGVTTVRGMLGEPGHLTLRDDIRSGRVFGPRLITSGPSFNGQSVDGPRNAAEMVRQQAAAGYDFLKIHPGLSREEFDAIAETATEVGIPFAGHVPEDVGVEAALEAGIATIDHLDGYMQLLLPRDVDPSGGLGGFFGVLLAGAALEEKIPAVAQATARAGVWHVPTESLFEHVTSSMAPAKMAEWPEMQYMPSATVREWQQRKAEVIGGASFDADVAARAIELRRKLIKALNDTGNRLLLGSDSPQIFNVPGFAIHRELEYLVEAGLTPYEALRTGTVNPARFFGQSRTFGAVEPGLEADLILLDDNPFERIEATRRIHGVMLRGQWMSRRDLDRRLKALLP